jgi:hypothetical protein
MAVLLQLNQSETWLCLRALASTCAGAALAGEQSRHARLLCALQLVARGEPFVATSAGVRLLADLLVQEGVERQDAATAGGLLARLGAVGVGA